MIVRLSHFLWLYNNKSETQSESCSNKGNTRLLLLCSESVEKPFWAKCQDENMEATDFNSGSTNRISRQSRILALVWSWP